MKRTTIFKVIALALPLITLIVLEVGLRTFNYGNDYKLFETFQVENQPDYLVMNPEIGKKYFRSTNYKPDNHKDIFLKKKTSNTFRIAVQGASTVVGFPFYHSGAFPAMLEQRLAQTFPEKNIEVINTAMTAVNSYTLLDFADEIIAQQPDVVIIYAGHNEYYGALGAGSSTSVGNSPWLVRTYLKAKKLRLFQWLENTYLNLSKTSSKAKKSDITMMEKMAKHQRIALDSGKYNAGISQFKANMALLLSKYQKHHIPVIISTLVSNEKETKPFISELKIDTAQFNNTIKYNRRKAADIANIDAEAAYLLGQFYLNRNTDSAAVYLHRAKELDMLRFRAPETINMAIKELSKTYNCHLVNMEEVFLKYTGNCSIGNKLLTEHLHPNVEGHFVMADAFYHKIKALNLLDDWHNEISFEEAFRAISVTKIDSIRGQMVVENLKKSWPYDLTQSGKHYESTFFEEERPTYEQLRALDIFNGVAPRGKVMAEMYKWYHQNGQLEECLKIVETDINDYPELTRFYPLAGNICLKLDQPQKATYYFTKYHQLEQSSKSALELAKVYLKTEQKERAKQTITEALEKDKNNINLKRLLQSIN